jgi:hypothetical protein
MRRAEAIFIGFEKRQFGNGKPDTIATQKLRC